METITSSFTFTFTLPSTSSTRTDPKTVPIHLRLPSTAPPLRRMTSTVTNATGSGSAKYRGTQMREQKLTELIETKVAEAVQVCEADRDSDECKVAWDEVEEVSQAKADLRRKLEQNTDPLQAFCEEHPETEECRIHEQ